MRDWTIEELRANEVIRSAYIRITCSWEALCNKGQQGLREGPRLSLFRVPGSYSSSHCIEARNLCKF